MDWGLRLYRRAPATVLGLSALLVAPATAGMLYLSSARVGERLLAPLVRAAGLPLAAPSPGTLLGLTFIIALVLVCWSCLIFGALVYVADRLWRDETPTVGAALLWGLRRFPALLVAVLLMLFIGGLASVVTLLVLSFVLGLAFTVTGATLEPGSSQTLLTAIGLGLLVLVVVVSISLWASFVYVPPAVVIERRGGVTGLGRGLTLAWGQYWRSTGFLWALAAFCVALSLVIFLPYTVWQAAVGHTGLDFVMAVADGLIWLLIFPVVPLTITVSYHDNRLRREAPDLEAQIQRLEAQNG